MRILLIGDVVGNLGCAVFQKHIDSLRKQFKIDGVIVNGENSSPRGRGITSKIVNFFKHNGANVITSGNHIWADKEIYSYIDQHDDLLRPANFPADVPGPGFTTFNCAGIEVGVINLQGRIFMQQQLDDPLRIADTILTYLKQKTKVILVDFHAETTAEKIGIAHYLDGRVSCVVGTHTHVQTADERILPKGTAFITDLGMCGSYNSMIGMKKDIILYNMKTQMPAKYEVDNEPPAIMSGVWVEVDTYSGKALQIERFRIIDEEIKV
ncbi:metallophosphoesterase [candidate division TM6 bacterium RIFCSPHIGHO2_12_FULL_32_22]|nr:MAG: metallophosphoesterase [candidate division TM6 bacterium RIFCSPHIGHO2_12_FULL_32_22]